MLHGYIWSLTNLQSFEQHIMLLSVNCRHDDHSWKPYIFYETHVNIINECFNVSFFRFIQIILLMLKMYNINEMKIFQIDHIL